jgi:hypothetical protein
LEKSLGIALILGLFAAGLGHLYLEYIRRGVIFIVLEIILVASIVTSPPYSGFGALLLLAIYAWSLADLYRFIRKMRIVKPRLELNAVNVDSEMNLLSTA